MADNYVNFYVNLQVLNQTAVMTQLNNITREASKPRNLNINTAAALTGLYAVSAAITHIGNALGALANNPLTSLVNTVSSSVTGVIGSTISSGLGGAGQRYDILRTFPMYMEAIGYSATDASAAVNKLNDSVLGLPTSLSDIVDSAKYFTLLTGDLEKGSDMAIALNNAFLASGTSAEAQATGMREVSYLLEGSTLTTRQWQSVIKSMPVALREMGTALGYVKFTDFTNALRHNQVSAEDFMNSLIEIGSPGGALSDLVEVQKNTVSGAMSNMRIAVQRAGANVLTALDQVFNAQTGEGLIKNLYVIRDLIDTIGKGIAAFIRAHQTEIMGFFNAITSFNWQQFLSGVLDGLTALMNIASKMFGMLPERFLGEIAVWGPRLNNDFNMIANVIRSIASVGMYSRLVQRLSGGASAASSLVASLTSLGGMAAIAGVAAATTAVYGLYRYLTQARREAGALSMDMDSAFTSFLATKEADWAVLENIVNDTRFGRFRNEEEAETLRGQINDALDTIIATENAGLTDFEYYRQQAISQLFESGINYAPLKGLTGEALEDAIAMQILMNRGNTESVARAIIRDQRNAGLALDEVGGILLPKEIDAFGSARYLSGYISDFSTYIEGITRELSVAEALQETANFLPYKDLAVMQDLVNNQALFDEDSLQRLNDLNSAYAASIAPITARINELDEAMAQVQQTSEETISPIMESAQKLIDSHALDGLGDAVDDLKKKYGREQEDGSYIYDYTDLQEAADENLQFMTDYSDLLNKVVEVAGEDYGQILAQRYAEPTAENMLELQSLWEGPEGTIKHYSETLNAQQQIIGELAISMDEVINQTSEKYAQLAQERENLVKQLGDASDLYQAGINCMLGYIKGLDKGGDAAARELQSIIDNLYRIASQPINATVPVAIEVAPTISGLDRVQSTRERIQAELTSNYADQLRDRVNAYFSATGGYVQYRRGGGSIFRPVGSDTVPAMLTPGEFVQNRTAVNAFGLEFMHRINNLDLAGALRSITRGSLAHAFGGFTVNNTRDNHANLTQNIYTNNAGYGFRRADRYVRAL